MSKPHHTRTDFSKDNWRTPDYLYNLLNNEFGFTLDPASDSLNHKTSKYFTINEDGLKQNWGGERVFVNPPFNAKNDWIKKCFNESLKVDTLIVLLIPVTTETESWYKYIWNNMADEIRFCYKRINFELSDENYTNLTDIQLQIDQYKKELLENAYGNKDKTEKVIYSRLKKLGIVVSNNAEEYMDSNTKIKAIEMINKQILLFNDLKDKPLIKINQRFDGSTFPPCIVVYRNPRKYRETKVTCFKHRD